MAIPATEPVETEAGPGTGVHYNRGRLAAIALGPGLAALTYVLLPDSYLDAAGTAVAFTHAGRATAAVAVWMATWWLTEAIDLSATALVPLVALPLAGATTMAAAAAPYANDVIFLFMGGFILSLAMQRWGLHRRIALGVLSLVGTRPASVVGGFMAATATLSMWLSNTATAVMMLPIAQSVIGMRARRAPSAGHAPATAADLAFPPALMLGIAYSASIGGLATIVGSPPNVFVVAYARDSLGVEISFLDWMLFGVPLMLVLLPITWLLLTRGVFSLGNVPGGESSLPLEPREPLNRGSRVTLVVFGCAVAGWLLRTQLVTVEVGGIRPLAGLTDAGIAMLAALALFVIPVNLSKREFTIDWAHASQLPWGILILFGGGLSLAAALDANGVGAFLGAQVAGWRALPPLGLLLLVTGMVLLLTELTSNTATAATLVPIMAGLAPGLGVNPMLLVIPVGLAASCAFMLPVATPPNAIVFGSGYVTMRQMRTAGIWLNLITLVLATIVVYWLALPVLQQPVR